MASAGAAFDTLSSRYDEAWTNSSAGRLQRDAVWRHIVDLFPSRAEVLDLGCGTGEDAVWLRGRGMRVTAIDASPGMVAQARRRGVDACVMKIEDVEKVPSQFAGVLSNFGAFNCVTDPQAVRWALAEKLPQGGHFALCVIGRFCLWETLWYAARANIPKAIRRWKATARAQSLGIEVRYHSASELRAALSPDFTLVRSVGIGITVPPSYVRGLPPTAMRMFGFLDRIFERVPFLSALADHRLLIFVRK
jgi:SAM-dependent methyltransferase